MSGASAEYVKVDRAPSKTMRELSPATAAKKRNALNAAAPAERNAASRKKGCRYSYQSILTRSS